MPILEQLVNTVSFIIVRPLQNLRIRRQVHILDISHKNIDYFNNRTILFTGCLFDILIEVTRELSFYFDIYLDRLLFNGFILYYIFYSIHILC